MTKSQASKSDRKKVKKALVKYYSGNYSIHIIEKLDESGVTVQKQDVYNYFSRGTGACGKQILEASYLLIDEAKIEAQLRAERLQSSPEPLPSTGTL